MADANLLEILDRESKLDNMIIYGNIRCAIDKPSYLSDNIKLTDGFFALVDVLALRCNGIDYFSDDLDQDSKHIYFSRGSIVVVITDRSLIGNNVRIYGRTTKGCTIKKQRTNNSRDGIVAFAWIKQDGAWCLVPNKVLLFGEKDARGTVLEDYIVSLVNGCFNFKRPNSVNSIVEYYGVNDNDIKPLSKEDIKGGMEYSTEKIDLSKVPLNLVHRLEASPRSEYLELVGDTVKKLRNKSKLYSKRILDSVKSKISDENSEDFTGNRSIDSIAEDIVHAFINRIASRYNIPLNNRTKIKGKDFVDDFLDSLNSVRFRDDDDNDDSEENSSSSLKTKAIDALKRSVPLDPGVLFPQKVQVRVLQDYIKFASLVIGEVTGIGIEDIVSNHNSCQFYNDLETVEWFWCLIRNPYLCGILGGNLGIVDCDRIFCGFSEGYDEEEVTKYRDMLIMLDKIKNASSRSTLINKRKLLSPEDTYPSKGLRYIEENGAPFSKNCLIAVSIIKDDIIEVNKESVGLSYDAKYILQKLNDFGIIEEVNDGIILTSDLYKEYFIYSKLIEKGEKETGITDKDIDKTIINFEKDKGFNLEPLQKDGIHLIKYYAGVLSGCAGSGKTTTSDCMVEGIKAYLPKYELRFGAPTGKAARRLAEVVGGSVKTIHSMFGLGLSSEPYITKRSTRGGVKNSEGDAYAYILDEMAMCNTNLMYEIVNNLDEDDLVYFLGDIKQLSPIGKGSPFRSLMHFLPCVELGVSKRASENGKINYNCGLINFVSDDYVVELQEGDDFLIKPCSDSDIQIETVNTFKDMLSRFEEDDIQVVTGYQTDKYPWSTVQLNPLLQKLLRKPTDLLYIYNNQSFMRNDRVIHVKRNAYDMPRYRMLSGNVFEEVVTHGIVNGELGKIIGYIKSTDCTIFKWVAPEEDEWNKLDSDMQFLVEKRKNTNVDIRDESSYKDESLYFVVVQTYDVDLKEDVIVLYHAIYKEDLSSDYAKTFAGGDLKYLDLAYALTTHKMQGSQSKAVIIPLGSSSSKNFMNRNMLNTMITRASKQVALIGSVKGKNSALTNGRRVTNIDEGEDVLGILAE